MGIRRYQIALTNGFPALDSWLNAELNKGQRVVARQVAQTQDPPTVVYEICYPPGITPTSTPAPLPPEAPLP